MRQGHCTYPVHDGSPALHRHTLERRQHGQADVVKGSNTWTIKTLILLFLHELFTVPLFGPSHFSRHIDSLNLRVREQIY